MKNTQDLTKQIEILDETNPSLTKVGSFDPSLFMELLYAQGHPYNLEIAMDYKTAVYLHDILKDKHGIAIELFIRDMQEYIPYIEDFVQSISIKKEEYNNYGVKTKIRFEDNLDGYIFIFDPEKNVLKSYYRVV